MNLVVVRCDSTVGSDEQRTRRRALAGVANRNRAADDPHAETLGRLGEKPLRGAVAERVRSPRRDRRRLHRETKNSPARPRASRPAARRRRPAGRLREGWPARRACSSSALPRLSSGLRGLRRLRSAASPRTWRPLRAARWSAARRSAQPKYPSRSTKRGRCRPSGFLKMRVKIRSAAATCGPASSAPTVGSTLPGSAVTTACWR